MEVMIYTMGTGNFVRLAPLFNVMSQNFIYIPRLGDTIGNSW